MAQRFPDDPEGRREEMRQRLFAEIDRARALLQAREANLRQVAAQGRALADDAEALERQRVRDLSDEEQAQRVQDDIAIFRPNVVDNPNFLNFQPPNGPSLGVLVYQDQLIDVHVNRLMYARQVNFAFQDHLFEIMVTRNRDLPSDDPIFLEQITHQICAAMYYIVDTIREAREDRDLQQIYFHFSNHENGVGGGGSLQDINMGGFDLHESTEKLVESVFLALESTLRSHDNLRLTDGFSCRVNTLSGSHVADARRLSRARMAQMTRQLRLAGAGVRNPKVHVDLEGYNTRRVFDYGGPLSLGQDLCLLISLAFARTWSFHLRYNNGEKQFKQEEDDFQVLKEIMWSRFSPEKPIYKKTLQLLESKVVAVCTLANIPMQGPHDIDTTIAAFCDTFEFNVSLIEQNGLVCNFQYPPDYRVDWPLAQLYQCSEKTPEQAKKIKLDFSDTMAHIFLLTRPKQLFERSGTVCPFCDKVLLYKNSRRHVCKPKKRIKGFQQCFACLCYIKTEENNLYVDDGNKWQVCIQDEQSLLEGANGEFECPQCDMPCKTRECLNKHKKGIYCSRGVWFKCCQKFKNRQGRQTKQDLRDAHDCRAEFCSRCRQAFDPLGDPHICEMLSGKAQTLSKRYCYFDFECYNRSSPVDCVACTEKETQFITKTAPTGEDSACTRDHLKQLLKQSPDLVSKLRCDFHKRQADSAQSDEDPDRSYHEPVAVSLLFERGVRGRFSRVDFYHKDLNHPLDGIVQDDVLECDYLPDNIWQKAKARIVKGRRRIGRHRASSIRNRKRKHEEEQQEEEEEEEQVEGDEEEEEEEDNTAAAAAGQNLFIDEEEDRYPLSEKDLKLPDMSARKNDSVIEKFHYFITQGAFEHSVFLAHNLSSYDSHLVLESFYDNNEKTELIMDGLKLIFLNLSKYKIQFIDSLKFVPTALRNFPKAFNLPEVEKGFFPFQFCSPEHFGYVGKTPDLHWFESYSDDEATRAEKRAYVEQLQRENYVYNLNEELSHYVYMDVKILAQGMSAFIRQCFELEIRILLNHGDAARVDRCTRVGPDGRLMVKFNSLYYVAQSPAVTISSYCMSLFQK